MAKLMWPEKKSGKEVAVKMAFKKKAPAESSEKKEPAKGSEMPDSDDKSGKLTFKKRVKC